jgi:hypothetical protein
MFTGRVLHGFCGGYFGRDSYGDKIIEGEGTDWIVVRENGIPYLATFDSEQDKIDNISDFIKQHEIDQQSE